MAVVAVESLGRCAVARTAVATAVAATAVAARGLVNRVDSRRAPDAVEHRSVSELFHRHRSRPEQGRNSELILANLANTRHGPGCLRNITGSCRARHA